eukprot:76087-Rhodomonas_salina.4
MDFHIPTRWPGSGMRCVSARHRCTPSVWCIGVRACDTIAWCIGPRQCYAMSGSHTASTCSAMCGRCRACVLSYAQLRHSLEATLQGLSLLFLRDHDQLPAQSGSAMHDVSPDHHTARGQQDTTCLNCSLVSVKYQHTSAILLCCIFCPRAHGRNFNTPIIRAATASMSIDTLMRSQAV